MLDPVPPPAPWLFNAVKPLADAAQLPTLPYHIHEVLFALLFYQSVQSLISPVVSNFLFPEVYPKLTKRTRLNWDVHVVSLVQSLFINFLALWVIYTDEERYDMRTNTAERVYGYTGAGGLIQGMACGYFLWDLVVSTRYIKIFGIGIWAHAVTALAVFSFGFRPYANYYGPCFILYELSSPFLNVHWFCDKLNLTGSKIQWYNGMVLLATFFGCRLIWGTYQSYSVFRDTLEMLNANNTFSYFADVHTASKAASSIFTPRDGQLCLGKESCVIAQAEIFKFSNEHISSVPIWLGIIYLICNVTLNCLNFYWFGKMIETVRKRFKGTPHEEFKNERKRRRSLVEEMATGLDHDVLSGPKTPLTEKADAMQMAGATTALDGDTQVTKRRNLS